MTAAEASNHKLTLCYSLAESAFPVAMMAGDFALAEKSLTRLQDVVTSHGLTFWSNWGRCLEGRLAVARGELARGLPIIRDALEAFRRAGWAVRHPEFLAALASGLAGIGQSAEGIAAIDGALARSARDQERWYVPELLRVKGELAIQAAGASAFPLAADCFREALDCARHQGALSWELRTALSFARLRVREGQITKARHILAPVFTRFSEGLETADLRAAATMLDTLGG